MLNRKNIGEIDSNAFNEITMKLTRGMTSYNSHSSFALVYAAFVAQENELDNRTDLLSFIEENTSEQRAMFVNEAIQDNIDVVFELSKSFSKNDLLSYMLVFPRELSGRYSGEYGTPESISKLATKVLEINENEEVADFGSGCGDFLTLVSGNYDKNPFYGIELNSHFYEISKIRAELFLDNVEVELGDMFAVPSDKKFDKIFSTVPVGDRLRHCAVAGYHRLVAVQHDGRRFPAARRRIRQRAVHRRQRYVVPLIAERAVLRSRLHPKQRSNLRIGKLPRRNPGLRLLGQRRLRRRSREAEKRRAPCQKPLLPSLHHFTSFA